MKLIFHVFFNSDCSLWRVFLENKTWYFYSSNWLNQMGWTDWNTSLLFNIQNLTDFQTNTEKQIWWIFDDNLSQLMRLWYLSHRWPAKAKVSLRICAVLPEPLLFTDMKYGSRRRVRPKIRRHLAPLDVCACAFEEWVYGGWKVP